MKLTFNFRISLYVLIVACTVTNGYADSSADVPTLSQLEAIELIIFVNNSLDNHINVLVSEATKLNDYIDPRKPTILYLHGWTEYPTSDSVLAVVGAYLDRRDHNVLLANYQEIAAFDYPNASLSIEILGYTIAIGLISMVEAGLNPSSLHLVGHSLGGQLAGAIGRNVNFKIPRIVALDPAGPRYNVDGDLHSLSPFDADHVQVIHTNAAYYGISSSIGHVDFYPNGRESAQPGCRHWDNAIISNMCSHTKSWKLYVDSLISDELIGSQCDSWENFKAGSCIYNATAVMGYGTPIDTIGEYYLQTAESSPFGRGFDGLIYVH